MLYLYVEKRQIKILSTKKALLGQQEVSFFNKKLEVDLLTAGRVTNVDHLASAIKEGLTSLGANYDRDVFLILPQESFAFLKAEVPNDIATSAIRSFVFDKARSTLKIDVDNSFCDFYIRESESQKNLSFFAIEQPVLEQFNQAFQLLHLKIVSILPETLAVFKLFEKTLRREKKENILYAACEKGMISGYLFDSAGLVNEKKWTDELKDEDAIEKVLKERVRELEKDGVKLNRIVLSGELSESIRQDTFTKNVGVWTNPLKRIIPNFYEEYVKQIITPAKQTFPILVYDVCFGAFVFSQENREFQMLKKPMKAKKAGSGRFTMPKIDINFKIVGIFLASLIATFAILLGLSKVPNMNLNFNFMSKPEPTPTKAPEKPTPTPVAIDREKVRIKILNGSGTKGLASEVKETLSEAGYTEILTGNADNFDYTKTVLQVKKSAKGLTDALKKDLADSVTAPKVETLDEDDAADAIIIIGSDLK